MAAFFTQPQKWWYLSELAQYLRKSPSSLQREIRKLTAAGILQQRREGTRMYVRAETRSPVFPELSSLFEKTAGVVPTLQQLLEPLGGRVDFAFIYGSLARAEESALSDIDLFVVGETGLAELSPLLRKAEQRLGRDVNAVVYSSAEFRAKIAARDHFVTAVMQGPKQFVRGRQDDLESFTG